VADILTRALIALGDLYSADSDRSAPEHVDMSDDIRFVHDVSRRLELEAVELSSVWKGFFLITVPTTHAAADTQTGAKNVYNELAALTNRPIAKMDAWIVDATIVTPNITATAAGLALIPPSTVPVGGTPPTGVPIITFSTLATLFFDGGASTFGSAVRANALASLPLFVPRGASVTTRVTSGAAGTIQSVFLLWAGLTGTRPPSVA